MLILTDGYFGRLENDCFIPSLKSGTILVLSGDVLENEDMRRIGKIASEIARIRERIRRLISCGLSS